MKIYKLKQFAKYQIQEVDDCKKFLKNDLDTISNLACFFIIEDIKNKELIDGTFFDFGKAIEDIKKENIKNKITYNETKLQEKEILNKVIKEFDKFVQDNVNFYLQNDAYKVHIFKISNSEKDRKKLKKILCGNNYNCLILSSSITTNLLFLKSIFLNNGIKGKSFFFSRYTFFISSNASSAKL